MKNKYFIDILFFMSEYIKIYICIYIFVYPNLKVFFGRNFNILLSEAFQFLIV